MKTNIDEPCAGNLQARFFRGSCSNKTQTRGVKLQLLPNSQRIADRTTGLVDYKELETNILSSIREGRPLIGKDGALTPFVKRLLEASLEGEIEHHLSTESEENNRRNGRNGKTLKTSAGSFELLTPRDREGSFGAPRSAWRTVGENPTQTKSSQQFGTDHYVA